ncbi:hypothetical protein CJF30_00006910 [Rutstroemia sp. NJR-2017a BBW]|nr:hypothetical protein CJF30_00006910 [Rutstroemia sp. NJR-2017a BBW]
MSGPVRDIQAPGHPAEGDLLRNMRMEVANLLGRNNPSFPGAQPVSFTRRHLDELTRQDYYVCEKSDGFRYLLYLTSDGNDECHYLIDRRNNYCLMSRTLDKRIAYFKERIFTPYEELLKEYPEEIPYMHFIMELKQMQFSYAVEMMFRQILPSLPHGNDGLIFTCRSTEYKHGTDQHILKWKPESENMESVIESIRDRVTEKDLIAAAKTIRDEWKKRAMQQAGGRA